jgi:lipoate-protein ligase A
MSKSLRLLDTGLAPARRNVAFTSALVAGHATGTSPGTLRFHRYPASVLLGASQPADTVADLDYCRRSGIEIARRVTGGGAVYMSPRMLAWELILARKPMQTVDGLTANVCSIVAAALQRLGMPARFRAPGDVVLGARKVSGSAGCVMGDGLALQGVILLEDDAAAMAATLRIPETALRAGVTCLREASGQVPSFALLQAAIADELAAAWAVTLAPSEPSDLEMEAAQREFDREIGTDGYVLGFDWDTAARIAS